MQDQFNNQVITKDGFSDATYNKKSESKFFRSIEFYSIFVHFDWHAFAKIFDDLARH